MTPHIVVLTLATLVSVAPIPSLAQGAIAPGGGQSTRRYEETFTGWLYRDGDGLTLYPATASGIVLGGPRAVTEVRGLPDSLRAMDGAAGIPVTVRRSWTQRGSQTPRLLQTEWDYTPTLQFARFQVRLGIETAAAPAGEIAVYADGKRVATYSTQARYSSPSLLLPMERPFTELRITVGDRVFWEGRYAAVPGRTARIRFTAGSAEIVSP